MIDFEFVEKLIRAIDESSLDSIEIERGGTRIRLGKTPEGGAGPFPYVQAPAAPVAAPNPAPAPAPAAPASGESESAGNAPQGASNPNWLEIKSPMVGTFYRAPSPESPPFVEPGTRITSGDPLCIIEAMKLMNELEAELDGTIREVLVENGEPVEYGQVLFRVDPA
jgi:acetyl-CoA carboxylase biotin carboxyl carrier protein